MERVSRMELREDWYLNAGTYQQDARPGSDETCLDCGALEGVDMYARPSEQEVGIVRGRQAVRAPSNKGAVGANIGICLLIERRTTLR